MSDTCAWCGHVNDCTPGKPGQSEHHVKCCLDIANAVCRHPAPKPVRRPKGKTGQPGWITRKQLTAITAAHKHKTRDESLAYISEVIGREVTSRSDLTRREASDVIDEMRNR